MTASGRLFRSWAAATGKARLPTVDSLMGGMTRRLGFADRRARRPGWSATATIGPRYRGATCIQRTSQNVVVSGPLLMVTAWPHFCEDRAVKSFAICEADGDILRQIANVLAPLALQLVLPPFASSRIHLFRALNGYLSSTRRHSNNWGYPRAWVSDRCVRTAIAPVISDVNCTRYHELPSRALLKRVLYDKKFLRSILSDHCPSLSLKVICNDFLPNWSKVVSSCFLQYKPVCVTKFGILCRKMLKSTSLLVFLV